MKPQDVGLFQMTVPCQKILPFFQVLVWPAKNTLLPLHHTIQLNYLTNSTTPLDGHTCVPSGRSYPTARVFSNPAATWPVATADQHGTPETIDSRFTGKVRCWTILLVKTPGHVECLNQPWFKNAGFDVWKSIPVSQKMEVLDWTISWSYISDLDPILCLGNANKNNFRR